MKKGFSILLMGFVGLSASMAQSADSLQYVRPINEQAKAASSTLLSFGFGFGGYYPYTGPMYSESTNLTFGLDNTLIKHAGPGNISLGAVFSYKEIASYYSDVKSVYNYTQHWDYYIIGLRAEYHWQPSYLQNIDTYAGAMAGYYVTRFHFSSNDPNSTESGDPGYYLSPNIYPDFVGCSVFVGARSYINKHYSAWLELGYGYTSLAFGVCYKI